MRVDDEKLQVLARELLTALGEDPGRPGLRDTPRRWANWWREFIEYDPGETATTFETISTGQMVCVSGMRVYSICEHHLLPFVVEVSIGYIADNRVLGLSKFARIAQQFAHQLQVQERLGEQISEEVARMVDTPDVAVLLKGEHLCMVSRGVRTPGIMKTTVMKGIFLENAQMRQEFFALVGSTT